METEIQTEWIKHIAQTLSASDAASELAAQSLHDFFKKLEQSNYANRKRYAHLSIPTELDLAIQEYLLSALVAHYGKHWQAKNTLTGWHPNTIALALLLRTTVGLSTSDSNLNQINELLAVNASRIQIFLSLDSEASHEA